MSGSTTKAEATLLQRVALFFLAPWIPWLLGISAVLLIAGRIDVADDLAWSADGPGLTFDEGFNVEVGVYLVEAFQTAGLAALHPETLREIYGNPLYNPDHPPLGRILLGAANAAGEHWDTSDPQRPYVLSHARLASAVEFGLLVLFTGLYTRRWFGPQVSLLSMLCLLSLPRVVAHAHLASLETCMNLTYCLFLFVLADRWGKRDQIRGAAILLPGILLGLAFLTKIHAILLLPVIAVWGFWNWGWRSTSRLFSVVSLGLIVFFLGWPWLWNDPANHLLEYFTRATERASLNCFYLGQKYADRNVPWHYPFVMFAVTTPLAILLSGLIGMTNRTGDENSAYALFDRRSQLLFGAWLLPLITFALPGVTVYDGVRLFLMSFPLFAIFAGLGGARILTHLSRRNGERVAALVLLIAFAGPVWQIVRLHPCLLSYYGESVGCLNKAQQLGFEATYWGDSVTPQFLRECADQLPEGATLEIAPVLHPLQLEFMRVSSWLRHRPDLNLKAYDDQRSDLSPYVLVIRRQADPWASLTPPPEGTQQLVVSLQQGVILAELLQLPDELPLDTEVHPVGVR